MDRKKPETMEEARRSYFRKLAKDQKEEKKKLISLLKSIKHRLVFFFILMACLVISFVRSNFMFTTSQYEFSSPYLPNAFNDFKIAQISDLHSKLFGKKGQDLIKAIDKEEVDIVVITGDLISRGDREFQGCLDMVCEIAKKYPTYYIRGNHEMYRDQNVKGQEDFYKELDKMGVIIAENRKIPLYRRQSRIDLIGLKEDYQEYKSKEKMDLEKYLGPKDKYFTILLAHNALKFDSYVDWGADLVLSGHVHGGVVRLPLVGGVFSPDRSLFPKYTKGLYKKGAGSMIVSAGLGGSMIPFRLFNRPELLIISLKSQSIR